MDAFVIFPPWFFPPWSRQVAEPAPDFSRYTSIAPLDRWDQARERWESLLGDRGYSTGRPPYAAPPRGRGSLVRSAAPSLHDLTRSTGWPHTHVPAPGNPQRPRQACRTAKNSPFPAGRCLLHSQFWCHAAGLAMAGQGPGSGSSFGDTLAGQCHGGAPPPQKRWVEPSGAGDREQALSCLVPPRPPPLSVGPHSSSILIGDPGGNHPGSAPTCQRLARFSWAAPLAAFLERDRGPGLSARGAWHRRAYHVPLPSNRPQINHGGDLFRPAQSRAVTRF